MKSIKDKLTAECRSEELEQSEKIFTVKYLGNQTNLGKDFKDVDRAVTYITEEAFTKKKRKQLSISYTMYLTEQNVSLFTQGGNCVFRIPVEKMSYSFHAAKKYYILSLAKHVSTKEVDIFVICCDSIEKLNSINSAFYFVFKGRRFALLRAKREQNKKELTMRLQNAGQKRLQIDKIKANPFAPKEDTPNESEENAFANGYSFANHDDVTLGKDNTFAVSNGQYNNKIKENPFATTKDTSQDKEENIYKNGHSFANHRNHDDKLSTGHNKPQVETKQHNVKSDRYSLDVDQKTSDINRHTAIIDVHHDNDTSKRELFDNTRLVANVDATKQQFDQSSRRYPRSSWC